MNGWQLTQMGLWLLLYRLVERRTFRPSDDLPPAADEEEWDDGEVAIANVPRGTAVAAKKDAES